MPAKRNSMIAAGGFLLFLGSLIYLYTVFTGYFSGTFGAWLNAAQFFAPFVAAFAIVVSITLFFIGLEMTTGKVSEQAKSAMKLWKTIMAAGVVMFIVAPSYLFLANVLGFLLTFIGVIIAMM